MKLSTVKQPKAQIKGFAPCDIDKVLQKIGVRSGSNKEKEKKRNIFNFFSTHE